MKKTVSSVLIRSCAITIFPAKTAKSPMIMRMLVIFDPTTLATTISGAPCKTPAMDDASSGSDVPNPTMSTPMMNGESPTERPTCLAPTKKSDEPRTRIKSEPKRNTVQRISCVNSMIEKCLTDSRRYSTLLPKTDSLWTSALNPLRSIVRNSLLRCAWSGICKATSSQNWGPWLSSDRWQSSCTMM